MHFVHCSADAERLSFEGIVTADYTDACGQNTRTLGSKLYVSYLLRCTGCVKTWPSFQMKCSSPDTSSGASLHLIHYSVPLPI